LNKRLFCSIAVRPVVARFVISRQQSGRFWREADARETAYPRFNSGHGLQSLAGSGQRHMRGSQQGEHALCGYQDTGTTTMIENAPLALGFMTDLHAPLFALDEMPLSPSTSA